MTHVTCVSKLRLIVRSSLHPSPMPAKLGGNGNRTCGRVLCPGCHALSTGIKRWYCIRKWSKTWKLFLLRNYSYNLEILSWQRYHIPHIHYMNIPFIHLIGKWFAEIILQAGTRSLYLVIECRLCLFPFKHHLFSLSSIEGFAFGY